MNAGSEHDVVYFGKTDFRGQQRLFGIKRSDRRQHMYVIGKTGTGKTTLIKNMVVQDISNGEGCAIVDPHGEFAEELLEKIPKHRINDVIYFNPADTDYHIGFNVLELPNPRYKHLVASGLMGIFTKIWAGVWSARMEYILNNAILALLETPGTTLLGITRILVDKDYRQKIIANVTDPVVRAFWVNEYEQWKDQFRNEAIAPIQNKVGQFLSTALIRNIVGQSKSTIDIFEIMNTGKIFLINVSKGRIGEDNSALLGSMIITKIQLSAMERVRIPEDERVDFFLYVDEFQNFATDSFANILSEARKYRLNLIMAHQYIGQLVADTGGKVSTKVRDAVFGNVGTMVMFRVGAGDAEFLEKEYEPEFNIQDMVNLPNRAVYLKLMVDGVTSRPFSAATLPPFKASSECATPEDVIQNSNKKFGRPRYIVEDEILNWSSAMTGVGVPGAPSSEGSRPHGAPSTMSADAGGAPREREGRAEPRINTASLAALGIQFQPQDPARQKPRQETPRVARPEERRQSPPPFQEKLPVYPPSALSEDRHPNPPPQQKPTAAVPAFAPTPSEKKPDIKSMAGKEEKTNEPEGPSLSLKDLKPREDVPKPKHEPAHDVDVASLRNAIQEALGGHFGKKTDGEKDEKK